MLLSLADIFSILNALSGFFGLYYMFEDFRISLKFVFISVIMDGLDGLIAKKKGGSRFGKELDSLADFLSFGILLSLILFKMGYVYASIPFLTTSMLRLARFNVLELEDFVGLPTTASALILASMIVLEIPYVNVVSLILSALMVSNFRYRRPRNKILLITVGTLIVFGIFHDLPLYLILTLTSAYVISPMFKKF